MEITEKEFEELKAKSEQLATYKKNLSDRGFDSVEDLLADRDQAYVDKDKLEKNLTKSGEVIARQGAELGQLRKVVSPESGVQTTTTPSQPVQQKPAEQRPQERPVEEELPELESKMTDEHWETVDSFYATMSEAEAKKIADSDEERRKLYKTVLDEKPVIPKSLRETVKGTNQQQQPTEDNSFSGRFKKFLRNETYTPAGPGRGAPRAQSAQAKPNVIIDSRTR